MTLEQRHVHRIRFPEDLDRVADERTAPAMRSPRIRIEQPLDAARPRAVAALCRTLLTADAMIPVCEVVIDGQDGKR
jgi:hypothetical protein